MENNSKRIKKLQLHAVLVSLAFSLTFLFFPAVETFLLNPVEFHIPARVAIIPLLLFSLGISFVLWLLLNILILIHEKIFYAVMLLFYGMMLAGYVQILFYNRKLSLMTNIDKNEWPISDPFTAANWYIIFAITIFPFILFLLQQVQPVIKFVQKIKWKSVPFICSLILAMQMAGILSDVGNYLKYDPKNDKAEMLYMSYEPLTSFSKNNNIIVFLTDRLDGTMIDDILKMYPELNTSLDGFTFYQNNVSGYTNTFPSLPSMLSGKKYQGEGRLKFITSAWQDNNPIQRMYENNFQIRMILDSTSTYYDLKTLAAFTDNLKTTEYYYNYKENGILQEEITLSLYRTLPYLLKKLPITFFPSTNNDIIVDDSLMDFHALSVSKQTDINFYNYLKNNKLSADCSKDTFSFIHLNAAHDSNNEFIQLCEETQTYDSSVFPEIQNNIDIIKTLRCSFSIIEMYIYQMKELGIYDNTTIIILGDHGRAPTVNETTKFQHLKGAITTGLLIKPQNADHDNLKIDSETEMSNFNFTASILEYAGLPHNEFGHSYSEILNGQLRTDRILDFYTQNDMIRYHITGDSRDFSNWEPEK